ncbi:hypothetical protein SAMN04487969_101255 [Paenibacillus algorifonticola]|uniref:Sporulation lipoprotein YhcN/YlaJ (Spore_YhcN_YlaJ) n=1 Tax=Paenibacillus algorifonticola TaxID=684063 RepID=A0A1I1Y2H5_9BACL|nr:hypothetical protein [Paenibacillus algorifonticola]SFE13764.1 hypothetical protein SAMN04487969_101255 [Paenibacillus algorifonticola]
MRTIKRSALLALLACTAWLSGCMDVADKRTPEQWLSLSAAGLAATDTYSFSGSTSIIGADGWSYTPRRFSGEVVNHEQVKSYAATAADQSESRTPAELLKELQQSTNKVSIQTAATAEGHIVLQAAVDKMAAKRRWEQRLTAEMAALASQAPAAEGELRQEWLRTYETSHQELQQMLSTLEVDGQYKLTIDRSRLVPLQLEEQTIFAYQKQGKRIMEKRTTNISLSAFDGSTSP